MPIPAPHESDSGTTGAGGPFGPSTRKPEPARADEWRSVPGKPYLQENVRTGQLRTNNYQPSTKV